MYRIALLSLLLLFACNPTRETDNNNTEESYSEDVTARHEEVMAIHDEVMPRMQDLFNEKQRLTGVLENSTDETEQAILEEAITDIDHADEVMMSWMRNFNPQQFEDDTTALIDYYKKEKASIEEVRDIMNSALSTAREL